MSAFFRLLILLVALTPIAYAQSQETPAGEQIDEVLVIGEQAGPSLWKVYKDDHVLWILGTLTPLPKKMTWRSHQAEAALLQSQELLLSPEPDTDVSPWAAISTLPSLIGIQKSPDGELLKDLVPADTYAHWLLLKEKYIGRDNAVEKYRPIFAGGELFEKSLKKADLNTQDIAFEKVLKIAEKHKLKITRPKLMIHIASPRALVKKFKKSPMDDVACFAKTLDRLETDLNAMRGRANAWAVGDVETLTKLPVVDNETPCFEAMKSSSLADDIDLKTLPEKFEALWMASVDAALANNASTFAVLPINEILKPDGALTKLHHRGYRVVGYGFESPSVE